MTKLWNVVKKTPTELATVIFVFWGILALNRGFAHLRILELYIVEALIVFVALTMVLSIALNGAYRQRLVREFQPVLVLYFLFALVGVVYLFLSMHKGFMAFRQSLIVLYVSLFFVFYVTFQADNTLKRFLAVTCVLFTLVIGLKILAFEFLGFSHADESYRVRHDEVDTIFASLSLMGMVIFFKDFFSRQKILTVFLIALDLAVLVLTIKRTALLGILVCAVLYFLFAKNKLVLVRNTAIIVGIAAVALGILFLVYREGFDAVVSIAVGKIDIAQERNSTWRATAWDVAITKIGDTPLWGHGFGERILSSSIYGNQTFDPHNSFLALFFYTGVFGLPLLLFLIGHAVVRYVGAIRKEPDEGRRKLLLFSFCGLVFMTIFAFLNVVLENQRQAIFFWFFLSGAYFLTKPHVVPLAQIRPANRFGNLSLALAGIAFVVCMYLPFNLVHTITVYHPDQNGQIPQIWNGTPNITMTSELDAISIEIDAKTQDDSPTLLFWVLTEDFYDNVAGREKDFDLKIDLAEPLTEPLVVSLWRSDSTYLRLPDAQAGETSITLSLEEMAEPPYALSQYMGFSLQLPPATQELKTIRITKIEIVDHRT